MLNTNFATALVSAQGVGVTICAENIGRAFEVANDYLIERHPRSEVIVQAVQRINPGSAVHEKAAEAQQMP